MKIISKISSAVILIIIAGILIYLSVTLEEKKNYQIKIIELIGNSHLTTDQYLKFANLDKRENYEDLTLLVIKDRLEKHPYLLSADVSYEGNSKVTIIVKEKKFEAIILSENAQNLVTDQFEVLPILPFTRQIDYPVINNFKERTQIKIYSNLIGNSEVVKSFKILSAVRLTNPELYDQLAEIDLRNGGDIILNFSFINYPVIIGRENEVRKIVYLNKLWSYLKSKDINNYMEYIDLRFEGHIYLGLTG